MSGDSRLNSNLCSLTVSNLSDHNNIRILTEDRSKGCRESHLCFYIYLNLIDTVDICLDRIFYRDNIYIFGI